MIFADLALAQRLELTNTISCVEFARAHAQLYPHLQALSVPMMGGYATYAGIDSPITQAFGLGLNGAVEAQQVEELEDFYFSRKTAVNIELCPLAHISLLNLLMDRGYRIIETSNVLFRELHNLPPEPTKLVVRQPANAEDHLWSRVIAMGFVESEEPEPFMLEITATMFHTKDATPFLVEVNGKPAGGGALSIYRKAADFYAHATLPAFRGHGAQSSLIQANLIFAAEHGCDIAMGTTACGSTSQRNFERQGFRIAYTRTKLFRAFNSPRA